MGEKNQISYTELQVIYVNIPTFYSTPPTPAAS